jgi:hypothetical protein
VSTWFDLVPLTDARVLLAQQYRITNTRIDSGDIVDRLGMTDEKEFHLVLMAYLCLVREM